MDFEQNGTVGAPHGERPDPAGRIALVTGGNRGIGLATARALAELGMHVVVGARGRDRGRAAARSLPGTATAVPIDLTDEQSAAAAAEEIGSEFGRLDVLVNNAGIAAAEGSGPPSATAAQALRDVFETNVVGTVAVTAAMLPLLRRSDAGRIVNVSSEVGSIALRGDRQSPLAALPPSLAYPCSKAALNMATAAFAAELEGTTIKVNAANPGYCATDLNGHSGYRTAEQGAEVSVALATLPADGPTGVFWGHETASGPMGEPTLLPW
ncbi:SDR family oxidoreductase [Nocardiopsis coralliicola]